MDNVELAIRLTADADDAVKAADSVGDAYGRMAGDVDDATRRADDASSRMDTAADAADNMASRSSQAAGGIGDLGGALALMPGPLGAVGAGMEAVSPAIMGVTGAADLMNLAMTSSIVTQTKAKAAAIANAVASKTVAAATKAWAATQWLLNAAMTANPVGIVVVAIIALVAAVVLAYKKSETFREVVNKVFRAATAYIRVAIKVLTALVGWIKDKAPDAWRKLQAVASAVIDRVVGFVQKLRDRAVAVWAAIRDKATAAWGAIRDRVANLVGAIVDRFQSIRERVSAVWTAIRERVADALSRVGELAGNARDKVVGVFQTVKDKLGGIWDGIANKVSSVVDRIVGFLQPIIDKIEWVINNLGKLPGVGGGKSSGRVAASGRTAAGDFGLPAVASGGVNVTVNVPGGYVASEQQLAKLVGDAVDARLRLLGAA